MDGDGVKDLLVGCSSTNVGAVGGVLLFRGDRAGSLRYLSTIRQREPERADACGSSVAVGDVDGDGRPESPWGASPTRSTRRR